MRKLTKKEQFDIRTMMYFMPVNKHNAHVTELDKVRMADLSSKGIQPDTRTQGFLNLLAGKTYRDLQITEWADGVRKGLFTKHEIYSSLPEDMQDWGQSKLKDVPYDVDGETSAMFVKMYQKGLL